MALATLLARDAGEKLWTKEFSPPLDDGISLAPMFVTQPSDLTVFEGQPAHFDCRVEPVGDGSMKVEWFHNEKPIQIGSRTHTLNDFGFVVLDIDWTFARDSGVYKCLVTNKCGSLERSANLQVISKKDLEEPESATTTLAMVHVEKALQKYTTEMFLTEDDVFDSERMQKPRFMSQMQHVIGIQEMQPAKFEVQLAPVGDPSMKVDWFFNGEPLIAKTQFMTINDFGYIALNFGWVYRQDSGEYMCRATNAHGSAEIKATLQCHGKTGIIYDSQLPKGMSSMEQIQDMELKFEKPWAVDEAEVERSKPCFMTKPEPVTAVAGTQARFCCRVTGYPKPRVMWLINGQTVINGSRRKLIFDGMWHLEIPRVTEGGKIEVIARNQQGEAYATTTLKVRKRRDDFRNVLKEDRRDCSEIMASKQYRKPVWLQEMEQIKERLAAVVQAAKITKEIQTNRIKAGGGAIFTAGISGNPRPEVTWWFNGSPLTEGPNAVVTLNDDSCTLTLSNCGPEAGGVYECRIQNKLSSDKTKASLVVAAE